MKQTKKMMIIWLATIPSLCLGQAGSSGSTGLAFLKLGVGGRASAMGEAYSSVANDATATFWNPAGLNFVDGTELVFVHTEWIQDVSNEFLAFTFPAFHGQIGLSFNLNNIEGIERRVNPTPQPLGTVDANDVAFGISYARNLSSSLNAGVTFKYLYEKIFIDSAAGYAVDFGATFQPFLNPLKLAVVVQNFGSMGKLRHSSIELPTTIRIGGHYLFELSAIDGAVIIAADAVKILDAQFSANIGAEVLVKKRLALRIGYQTGFDQKSVSGGFGLISNSYTLDYGFTPFDSNFGDTHRFTLGLTL